MRNNRMDNIKFFLIFCVVFGHMLELVDTGVWYKVIYSFHMPAFIFVSGYFAQFNRKKIISVLVYPYILFQCLYLLFDAVLIKQNLALLKIQFTTPYWLLWYLVAMIFYYTVIPYIVNGNFRILFGAAVFLSLIAGMDASIGYYLSLSRFFTFLPYFILGVGWKSLRADQLRKSSVFKIVNVLLVLITCYVLGRYHFISNLMLYGSLSYARGHYNFIIKGILLLCGINWIFFFMWIIPSKSIPLITSVGKNTLIIFLLHGFIVKSLEHIGGIFVYSKAVNICLAALISLVIVFLFGNDFMGSLGKMVFTGKGIEKIAGYCRHQR